MVIEVFQWCFNATMGVMLRLPIIFISFAYAFLLYCDQSTVRAPSTMFLFISLYLHDSRFTRLLLEYSLWNIPLYY